MKEATCRCRGTGEVWLKVDGKWVPDACIDCLRRAPEPPPLARAAMASPSLAVMASDLVDDGEVLFCGEHGRVLGRVSNLEKTGAR